jgi:glucose-6-phosphate-specific signal transduction histidine kinase
MAVSETKDSELLMETATVALQNFYIIARYKQRSYWRTVTTRDIKTVLALLAGGTKIGCIVTGARLR